MVQELTALLARGGLAPGERIGSEQDLIRRFGLSRASVREALRLLERDGLVTVKPGPNGGVFCGYPSAQPLARSIDIYGAFHDVTSEDLVEARTELEVLTARLAAQRATPEVLHRLETLDTEWARAAGAREEGVAAQANVAFHLTLARAADNPVFVAFMEALEGLVYEVALEPDYSRHPLEEVVRCHHLILEAVRRGDPEAAGRRMREHLESFRPEREQRPQGRETGGRAGRSKERSRRA